MAMVDGDRDEIVVRILYDGPPLAGKTTNLRALTDVLAARRRSDLFTPGEAEGRTLYFDWMDYLGGWFNGNQVRCQLVAAPGQRSLVRRREALVQDADVVVLVLEATPAGVEAGQAYFAELIRSLRRPMGIPVPVIVQANKQDLQGALSEEEVREAFGGFGHVAVLGASASEGTGVREAFTFAVRLALDRVRALEQQGALLVGTPEVRCGEDLLARIQHIEQARAPRSQPARAPVSSASGPRPAEGRSGAIVSEQARTGGQRKAPGDLAARTSESVPTKSFTPPLLPDSRVESGMVWPPVTGRVLLHDLERDAPAIEWAADGSWASEPRSRWCLHSAADEDYGDMEQGRAALLRAARTCASLGELLGGDIVLVLAKSCEGRWRLWRVRRHEPSLLDRLLPLLEKVDAVAAEEIFRIADALVCADTRFRAAGAPFSATLATVGIPGDAPCHIGLLPAISGSSLEAASGNSEALVRREFGPLLSRASDAGTIDALAAVSKMSELLAAHPERADVIEALVAMLIGE